MQIVESKQQGVLLLELSGKLDSFTSKAAQAQILQAIERGETHLIIDGSQLEYVSSAGLRVFYLAAHHLEEHAGKMVFAAINSNVRRVFDIVDLSSEFVICATREDALQQFSGGS